SGHGYREAVKNELRQLFYIPHLDAAVRKESTACVWCKVRRVDYIGPFDVTVGRRTEKRWIVLLTCLVVRGIHLEVAHGLTTQSCLMALQRFICRRGWPVEFLSDNGTNFQGASKEITATVAAIQDECADQFTNARTKWTFNPPVIPHMGGVWKRLVRSVKEVLAAINDGRRLTDEILQTAIVEAEDIIYS
uniref:Integrase catalytic domain-containing protein n=1 Tax=Anopheles dirus TaxID=7168 RepID=A0A182NDH5_9DIPT